MFMAEDLPKEFDKHLFGYKKNISDEIYAKYMAELRPYFHMYDWYFFSKT